MIDLRVGRWQDVLQGVEVDCVCVDPPYGARTHEGNTGLDRYVNANSTYKTRAAEVAEIMARHADEIAAEVAALDSLPPNATIHAAR